ncbi:MAG: alpha/beta hydrolase, partial [Deltaproteobacteria bacterium]|nr:alpha/beta hydrolase [Deltaproteobacteria bacterium]
YRMRHPDRVSALILIDSGPGYQSQEPRELWNQYAEGVATALESGDPSAIAGSSETRSAKHRSTACLALAARGMMKQYGTQVIDSLKNVRVPTLIIVGADDQAFLAAAEVMATKIPKAEKHVIPDAGHAPNLDQPKLFNELVMGFLRKVEAERSHLE